MKNNTLKAMGIAIGAALSLMYATGIEAQAAEVTPADGSGTDPEGGIVDVASEEKEVG